VDTEITISPAIATEGIRLIEEYLYNGGSGFDHEKLESLMDAIQHADRIVVMKE